MEWLKKNKTTVGVILGIIVVLILIKRFGSSSYAKKNGSKGNTSALSNYNFAGDDAVDTMLLTNVSLRGF